MAKSSEDRDTPWASETVALTAEHVRALREVGQRLQVEGVVVRLVLEKAMLQRIAIIVANLHAVDDLVAELKAKGGG